MFFREFYLLLEILYEFGNFKHPQERKVSEMLGY